MLVAPMSIPAACLRWMGLACMARIEVLRCLDMHGLQNGDLTGRSGPVAQKRGTLLNGIAERRHQWLAHGTWSHAVKRVRRNTILSSAIACRSDDLLYATNSGGQPVAQPKFLTALPRHEPDWLLLLLAHALYALPERLDQLPACKQPVMYIRPPSEFRILRDHHLDLKCRNIAIMG